MSWGNAVNNAIGFGYISEASERNLTNGDVRLTESGDYRVTEDSSESNGYASIYFSSWSGQTDLINNG